MTLAQKGYVDDSAETERSRIFACDDYRATLEKIAPLTLTLRDAELNAAVCAVVVAKGTVDRMHPAERAVHSFDQAEIRKVEASVRDTVVEARDTPTGDKTITLTADEIEAIEHGIADLYFSQNRDRTRGMRLLEAKLSDAKPHVGGST